MNNPENSVMKNEQEQQINFEHELNGIKPNSNNSIELNVGNENAGDKESIAKETVTCLQDIDEFFDDICKQNKATIDINAQGEIDLENVNLNDLNTSGEINTFTEDNLKNWQNIFEDFIEGTKLNAVEYNNNHEEDRNMNNSEVLMDSVENFNKNNNLETWNGIYENLLAITNPVAAVNGEDSLIISRTDIHHDNAMLNFTEHDKKESSSQEIRGSQFKINITNNKNTIVEANLNKNNTNSPNLIKKIPSTFSKNEVIIISSDEEDAIEIVEYNVPCNNNVHKNPTNTNEFEEQEVGTDCDGYNSSDFEFIDEDEARNAPYFKWLSDEPNYTGATTKIKPNFEEATAMVTTNRSPNFAEQSNEGGELSLSKLKSVLGIHDHQETITYTEYDEQNNIIYDYFKSLQSALNTNEFDTNYIDNHRIPNDEEYLHLFGGNNTPYAMNSFENKATDFGTSMAVNFDEGNFAMRASMRCESTPEQRREAKETAEKILSMYSIENIGRNLRRRR